MNPSNLYTDTPNAIGNSLLVDPLVTMNATSGDNYINITESSARSDALLCLLTNGVEPHLMISSLCVTGVPGQN